MPVAVHQAEIDGELVLGPGTDYIIGRAINGVGNPPVRDVDTRRGNLDGDVGGTDTHGRRLIALPVLIRAAGDGGVAASTALGVLKRAWRRRATDVPLDLWLPSWAAGRRFYGRPGDLDVDYSLVATGNIDALATFRALDPFGYGAAETVTDSSSPATVTNSGDVPSDRFTVAITGNGGTPAVTNTTDEAAAVVFNTALAGGAVAVLNFRTHTMTVNGTATYLLAPGSRWFRLLAGANTLTFSGCASIEVVHRPAFL